MGKNSFFEFIVFGVIAIVIVAVYISSIPQPQNIFTYGLSCSTKNLDWGSLSPGQVKISKITIQNTGNLSEILSLTVGQWVPEQASLYMNITWNLENTTLLAYETRTAEIILSVSQFVPEEITFFSNEISITGTVVI